MSFAADLEQHLKTLHERNLAMLKALEEIAEMGKVCPEFDVCKHGPCGDSAGACLVAINCLTDLGLRVPGQTRSRLCPICKDVVMNDVDAPPHEPWMVECGTCGFACTNEHLGLLHDEISRVTKSLDARKSKA